MFDTSLTIGANKNPICFRFRGTVGSKASLTKMERLLQGCSSVAATMQQSNMYATTGGDKVAN